MEKSSNPPGVLETLLWSPLRNNPPSLTPNTYPVPWTNESIVRVCFVIKWLSGIHVRARIWCSQLIIGVYQRARSLIVWHSSVCCDQWLFSTQVCAMITDWLALKCAPWPMIVWHLSHSLTYLLSYKTCHEVGVPKCLHCILYLHVYIFLAANF